MSTSRRARLVRALVTIGICALLSPSGASTATAQEDAAVAMTTVRFVHAVPAAPNADVRVDGNSLVTGLAYGAVSDYVTVEPGDRDFAVIAADTSEPVAETSTAIDEGSSYVLTILGQVGDIRIKVNEMELDALDPGKARARLINASPDAGEIDLAVPGGDSLFDDVLFEEDTEYKEIDAGSYGYDVRAGDDDAVATTFTLEAQIGRVYDLVALGLTGDQTLRILPVVTNVSPPCSEILGIGAPTDACLRVVHADPDLGSADAVVAGSVIMQALPYGQASGFVAVPAGEDLPASVVATGQQASGDEEAPTYTLDAGQAYEVIAWTSSDEATPGAGSADQIDIYSVDLTPLPADQGRIRLVNVGADAGKLDVVLPDNTDDPDLFAEVGDSNASRYEVLDAGDYRIEIHLAGEDGSVFDTTLSVESGVVYDLVALGRFEGDAFQLLVLIAPAQVRSDHATPAVTTPGATPIA